MRTAADFRWQPAIWPALAREIAARAAIALDNALLYEREREVSHSLQLGLLGGDAAEFDGVVIAAAYRPGTATLEVGGDWYDAFRLPSGSLALVVGDVVGHGLEAAVAMGQLRGALSALAQTACAVAASSSSSTPSSRPSLRPRRRRSPTSSSTQPLAGSIRVRGASTAARRVAGRTHAIPVGRAVPRRSARRSATLASRQSTCSRTARRSCSTRTAWSSDARRASTSGSRVSRRRASCTTAGAPDARRRHLRSPARRPSAGRRRLRPDASSASAVSTLPPCVRRLARRSWPGFGTRLRSWLDGSRVVDDESAAKHRAGRLGGGGERRRARLRVRRRRHRHRLRPARRATTASTSRCATKAPGATATASQTAAAASRSSGDRRRVLDRPRGRRYRRPHEPAGKDGVSA